MAEDVDPDKLEIADELIAERRSALPGQLPEDMPHWQAATISFIDRVSLWVGKLVSWFLVPLCIAMVYEVIARKFGMSPTDWWAELVRIFTNPDAPSVITPNPTLWAYDVSRMLYGAMFMLGAGYALSTGVHIRADFIYRNWSERSQATIDLIMFLVLYFPGMLVLLWVSADFALTAWDRNEKAMDTAWMPRLGPIKSAIPIGVFLLILQGISEVLKCLYAVKRGRWPV